MFEEKQLTIIFAYSFSKFFDFLQTCGPSCTHTMSQFKTYIVYMFQSRLIKLDFYLSELIRLVVQHKNNAYIHIFTHYLIMTS